MAFSNLREYVFKISPPWLRRHWGERLMGVQGLMGDLAMEAISQGMQVPWLRSGFQPPDVLPLIGVERSMPRYPADTDDGYRERLAEAWDSWLFAGNEDAITDQLIAFGLPNVVVVPAENADDRIERRSWRFELPGNAVISGTFTFTANDGGSGNSSITGPADSWNQIPVSPSRVLVQGTASNDDTYTTLTIDSTKIFLSGIQLADEGPLACTMDGAWWSRFAVIIEDGHGWVDWVYGGGGVYGDDDDSPTYGSTATVGEVRTVRSIIRKWKAGHTINPYIYIEMADTITGVASYYGDPDTLYGDAGLVYGGGDNIKWQHQV